MSGFKYPNQDEMLVGIVVGGDSEDPAPDKSGGFRVFLPSLYSKNNIKYTDLPFARMLSQATQEGVHSFNPPPERGTPVLVQKGGGPGHPGTGHLTVLGVLPNHILKGLGVPGGKSLTNMFMDAVNHQTDKKAPPTSLKTEQRDGAEIRSVQDNGMWYQGLTKSMPATATAWPMSGIALPAVTGVATAIQHSAGILNSSILGALPGAAMSLGTMFSMLQSSGALNQITAKLGPEVADALSSMSNLITTVELTSSYGFSVGGRVDPTTFLQNAVNILSAAQNIGDLVDAMNRLTNDESVRGTEKLAPVKIKVNGAFGGSSVTVDANGKVKATINLAALTANTSNANTSNSNTSNSNTQSSNDDNDPDVAETIKSIMGFVGILTSAEQAFSSTGENMFGGSAKMMFDMYNRVNAGATSHLKKLTEEVHTSQTAQKKIKPLSDLVFKGGKILSGRGFK